MLDFRARGFGFIPARKTERELSLKGQLVKRLEERFRKHQASLRVLTVSSLAMALSACKDGSLVQGSHGNDVYSYLLVGTDRITDTGRTDQVCLSLL